jgi:hypothetical protein
MLRILSDTTSSYIDGKLFPRVYIMPFLVLFLNTPSVKKLSGTFQVWKKQNSQGVLTKTLFVKDMSVKVHQKTHISSAEQHTYDAFRQIITPWQAWPLAAATAKDRAACACKRPGAATPRTDSRRAPTNLSSMRYTGSLFQLED